MLSARISSKVQLRRIQLRFLISILRATLAAVLAIPIPAAVGMGDVNGCARGGLRVPSFWVPPLSPFSSIGIEGVVVDDVALRTKKGFGMSFTTPGLGSTATISTPGLGTTAVPSVLLEICRWERARRWRQTMDPHLTERKEWGRGGGGKVLEHSQHHDQYRSIRFIRAHTAVRLYNTGLEFIE